MIDPPSKVDNFISALPRRMRANVPSSVRPIYSFATTVSVSRYQPNQKVTCSPSRTQFASTAGHRPPQSVTDQVTSCLVRAGAPTAASLRAHPMGAKPASWQCPSLLRSKRATLNPSPSNASGTGRDYPFRSPASMRHHHGAMHASDWHRIDVARDRG